MNKAFILLFAVTIACMVNSMVLADDSDLGPAGTPRIRLSSESTINMTQDSTKEFIIELKNVGSAHAHNLFIQATPEPTDPFTVSLEILGGSESLQIGATKRVKLTVNVEKGAAQKVYPISLIYNYINTDKSPFENTDKLNLKISNPYTASDVRLYNFSLSPETINAGETAELTFNYMNRGSAPESYLRISLEELDTATITMPSGSNSQTFTDVMPFSEGKVSFVLRAAKDCKSGSYPIKITKTVRDSEGANITEEEMYYISVNEDKNKNDEENEDAIIEVLNKVISNNVYAVGQPFSISFDIKNTSNYKAKNVIVKANPLEGDVIVPTSQSMMQLRELMPGQARRYTFTFAATSASKTQNYPISFTIEYDSNVEDNEGAKSKITFNQFFGVNISNPDKDKEDEKEDDEKEAEKNIPKIIISSYSCDPTIVKAGSEFELSMAFMNSHAEKLVKNIKISLTVTDKDDKQGASIFSPVSASNTLYIDQIQPKQTITRSIKYYAIPDAQPQNYSINVNFEYEDKDGSRITTEEIVGINVSQPPSIEMSELNIPEYAEAGMPVYIGFNIFNTGKVTVNNLKVTIEGDVPTDNKTMFIGNLESGSQETYEAQILPNMPGELAGTLILSYDSATGEHFEINTDFNLAVSEPQIMDSEMNMEMPEEPDSKVNAKTIGIGAAVVLALAGGGFAGFKVRQKKKKENDFYE